MMKVMGPANWSSFYRYVSSDIFRRGIVAWCIAMRQAPRCSNHCSPPPTLTPVAATVARQPG
jgi:hypothetical protein